ncbi:MAG: tRNA(Met) cytidine acetyltransferase [Thiogranum sp.]|nr:tRNA(Met) cytidine acetyltransferase [Thiogranum sp.]
MLIEDELTEAFHALIANARERRWRAVAVVTGTRDECHAVAQRLVQLARPQTLHWYSDRAPQQAHSSHGAAALGLLGTELDALVFDAWSGFNPDAFGALTGTVRAGGVLFLLAPPLTDWPQFDDPEKRRITVAPFAPRQVTGRYLHRLARIVEADENILLCKAGKLLRRATQPPRLTQAEEQPPAPWRSFDQQRAAVAVIKVATGHRRRPVVLVSDRGRGKSAAFGIAAAQLIQQGRKQILLTGPAMASVKTVVDHARALLPEEDHAALRFVAPDELARAPQPADLLLVDEAAALPAPLLQALLEQYSRIAFATTVHGYEGTGRGFAVRFSRILDDNTNSWKSIQLSEPIRWAADDPLERLSFRMLLMDANAAADESLRDAEIGTCSVETVDRDSLLDDEAGLAEIFGLLVLAHYRTRPLDLRHLLDGPNVSIHVLRSNGHVAGTVLVAGEGGFDAPVARAICAGESRPHGHLLPETLAACQGLCDAPRLRCARVLRIAVHPVLQRRGLGTRMIEHVTACAREQGYDYVGSSFGATPELLEFWSKRDWLPVRAGFRRGASSGCHSVLVLKPLSAAGAALAERARERYFAQFPHQLSDSLQDLEPALVVRLMQDGAVALIKPDEADWSDARAIGFERRLPETCIGSLWRIVCFALRNPRCVAALEDRETGVLVARVLQRRSWQECAALIGVPGRTQALSVLRSAVAGLIGYYADHLH